MAAVGLTRRTLGPRLWDVKAGQVHLQRDGQPTDRTYWLVVARNVATGEVEHAFRLAKTEVGFGHFEGRSWLGLLRHMALCQLVLLFVAERTGRLRGGKPGGDDGVGRAGAERRLRPVATTGVAGCRPWRTWRR